MKIANIPFPLMVLLIDHYKLAVQPDYGLTSKILHIQLPPCMMYIQKKNCKSDEYESAITHGKCSSI